LGGKGLYRKGKDGFTQERIIALASIDITVPAGFLTAAKYSSAREKNKSFYEKGVGSAAGGISETKERQTELEKVKKF